MKGYSRNLQHKFYWRLKFFVLVISILGVIIIPTLSKESNHKSFSANEPEFENINPEKMLSQLSFKNGIPVSDSIRVALQVGHWQKEKLPDEFEKLRRRKTGTSGGGMTEWQAALKIAQLAAEILKAKGIRVDILPATVPPGYFAHAFIAIHADGNKNQSVSGFKVAAPWWDITGKGTQLAQILEKEYQLATKLKKDENITPNMRGYYAFNWPRYQHAIHPLTPAVIIETGFLTSPTDQEIIIHKPEMAAWGIANAIIKFLEIE